jgi:hypothetical protein
VVAVGRDDVVVRAQLRDGPGAAGFLPDVEVAEAADLALAIKLGGFLLDAADQQHVAEHFLQAVGGKSAGARRFAGVAQSRGNSHSMAACRRFSRRAKVRGGRTGPSKREIELNARLPRPRRDPPTSRILAESNGFDSPAFAKALSSKSGVFGRTPRQRRLTERLAICFAETKRT